MKDALPPMPHSARKSGLLALLPSWIMFGAMVVLAAVVAALFAHSASREKAVMSEILFEKGTALIRAFESGARTGMGMRWSGGQLQMLLEETARQPDILYLAVTDENGLILAHNDRSMIGRTRDVSYLRDPSAGSSPQGEAAQKNPGEQRWRWRLTSVAAGTAEPGGAPAKGAFEVYGHFRLAAFPFCGMADCPAGTGPEGACEAMAPQSGQGPGAGDGPPGERPGLAPVGAARFIFAGFDVAPFERARQADLRTTALVSAAVLLVGLGLVLAMFMAGRVRAAHAALRDTRAFAGEIMANLPVGLITTGPDGQVASVNEAALRITGFDAERALGAPPDAIFPPGWCGLGDKLARGETVLEFETECPFGGGPAVPVSFSAARIVSEAGGPVGDVFILRDLREVRALREEIARREKLAALGSLAAGIAHEIRNPLSSIKGYATYFGGKFAAGSEEKQASEILIGEVDRLNRVITQLLEFARPGELRRRPVDPSALAGKALGLVAREAEKKGVRLIFEGGTARAELTLDPDRLTQALLNLYLNAVEATDPGGEVRVAVAAAADGGARIRVADTGRGIPEADLAQVFNPYFTTKAAGTGLGLAIVHKIVEGHGGMIEVESAVGRGAVFTVTLPGPAGAAGEHTEAS
jgi:two-component system sensor histidine kinase HydH